MRTIRGATHTTAWDRVRQLGTVSYRQFDFWIRCGRIHVDQPNGDGSGYHRTISDDELNVVAWMGRLVASGMLPEVAEPLARQIAVQGWATWDGIRIEATA
jgi:hypothetical protein